MLRALSDSIRDQLRFASRRLGVSRILVLGIAGVASAAYFMTAKPISQQRSSTGELTVMEAGSSAAMQEQTDLSVSATVIAPAVQGDQEEGQVAQGIAQDGYPGYSAVPNVAVASRNGSSAAIASTDLNSGIEPARAKRSNNLSERTEAAEDGVNDAVVNTEVLAATGEMTEQAVTDEVLHITNVGDKIIATYDQDIADAAVQQRSELRATQQLNQPPAQSNEEAQVTEVPQADYTEIYPGCPQALPAGSDAQMAQQLLAQYSCEYLSVCTSPNDEVVDSTCTWYLNKKLSI